MKKFKSKTKIKKKKKIKVIFYLFFFFFSYVFIFNYVSHNKTNKELLDKNYNIINLDIDKIISLKIKEVINNPVNLLDDNIKNVTIEKNSVLKTKIISNNITTNENKKKVQKEYNPVIYIYNTHQDEKYDGYSVYDASKMLNDMINNTEISSYFEEQSISTFLQTNNLKYNKSYTASRKYLQEASSKYTSLKYYFDIHRDSINKIKSTYTYQGKNYAKILFVVGSDNDNNIKNEENAKKLNNIIESKVPGISRGIIKHGGKKYNGVYNQDFSENVFLIEVGASENTKEEVDNTINILYESILEYVRGIL